MPNRSEQFPENSQSPSVRLGYRSANVKQSPNEDFSTFTQKPAGYSIAMFGDRAARNVLRRI
jgi:hypothetical protein